MAMGCKHVQQQTLFFFNLENVHKFFGTTVDTAPERNQALDADYETLAKRLFPHGIAQDG